MPHRIIYVVLVTLGGMLLVAVAATSAPLGALTIELPNLGTSTGAHIAVSYGSSGDVMLQFRSYGGEIQVGNIAVDNSEWSLGGYFTVPSNDYTVRYATFTPHSEAGVSTAVFTVYTTSPADVYTFTLSGARVIQTITPTRTLFAMTSISLPMMLRLNPVRDELYARDYADLFDPCCIPLEWRRLGRFSLTSRQETASLVLPQAINDYGITQDGRWLYAATDNTIYTIDLNSFTIAGQTTSPIGTPYRLGVFNTTLVYVSTDPGLASGGPVYQWNPQTNNWTATALCDSATDHGARAQLRVSADYTTLAGICDPYASPATSFSYRLGGALETWTSDIRWAEAVSTDGNWSLVSFHGNRWTGDFITMQRGAPNNQYVHATDRYSYDMVFSPYNLAYAAINLEPTVLEVNPIRAVQTRRFDVALGPRTYQGYRIPASDGLIMKGNWLYAAVWTMQANYYLDGQIVAYYINPFDISPPTSQIVGLPTFSPRTFTLYWSGTDNGLAGLRSYDVQYRNGPTGAWTDWLTNTTVTSAQFTGEYGHTYFFRSRARDWVDNLESYLEGNGDMSTYIYRHVLTGYTLGNRNQPIAIATVQSNPAALNTSASDLSGKFSLYFNSSSTYSLTITRDGFGTLPPMRNVLVSDTSPMVYLFLPPADDRIVNGGFESEGFTGWTASGEISPSVVVTAHTGTGAMRLGGHVPLGAPGMGPWGSTIEQDISMTSSLKDGTLSLLYLVEVAEPTTDTLRVFLVGSAQTATYTLPLNPNGWLHQWFAIPDWTGPTTLRIEWMQGDRNRYASVIIDEVNLGSAAIGSYSVYLPLVMRSIP